MKEEEDCPGSILAVTPDPAVIILFLPRGVPGSVLSSLHILTSLILPTSYEVDTVIITTPQ